MKEMQIKACVYHIVSYKIESKKEFVCYFLHLTYEWNEDRMRENNQHTLKKKKRKITSVDNRGEERRRGEGNGGKRREGEEKEHISDNRPDEPINVFCILFCYC